MNTPKPMLHPVSSAPYTGVENLEVMQEAVNYNRYLLDTVLVHAQPKSRILDFGAGAGQFAIPLRQRDLDVTAVEQDTSLRRILAANGVPALGSTHDLPGGSFDLIYSLNVMEHIDNDVEALRQLHACLRPAGRLLVYVPAFMILYTAMDAKVGHVRRYTANSLRGSVSAAGFSIERIAYVDSLGFCATLAFKLFDRGQGTINRTALKIYDRAIFPVSRWLDFTTHRWFGKNLLLIARKQ